MKNKMTIFLRNTIAALTVLSAGMNLMAQSTAVTRTGSLNITKEIKPPVLDIVDLKLEDPSGNNAIDADETCRILLTVRNDGYGDGMGLRGEIKARGTVQGLSYHTCGRDSDNRVPDKSGHEHGRRKG